MDKTTERKIYEIGYLLVPYLPAEEVPAAVERLIKAKLVEVGGEVTSEIAPTLTRLAYVITKIVDNKHVKFSDGYFGALRFKVAPDVAVELQKTWLKEDLIIRYLTIALVTGSENIIAVKRSTVDLRNEPSFEIERVMPEKIEVKPALSVEELDKEIDKLAV